MLIIIIIIIEMGRLLVSCMHVIELIEIRISMKSIRYFLPITSKGDKYSMKLVHITPCRIGK